jgi:hypothetical protein
MLRLPHLRYRSAERRSVRDDHHAGSCTRGCSYVVRPVPSIAGPLPSRWCADLCTTCEPPSAKRNQIPDCLNYSEGPRALQEPISRTQGTRRRKCQDKQVAALFQRITN